MCVPGDRRYSSRFKAGDVLTSVYSTNAFDTLSRSAMQSAIAEMPQLLLTCVPGSASLRRARLGPARAGAAVKNVHGQESGSLSPPARSCGQEGSQRTTAPAAEAAQPTAATGGACTPSWQPRAMSRQHADGCTCRFAAAMNTRSSR